MVIVSPINVITWISVIHNFSPAIATLSIRTIAIVVRSSICCGVARALLKTGYVSTTYTEEQVDDLKAGALLNSTLLALDGTDASGGWAELDYESIRDIPLTAKSIQYFAPCFIRLNLCRTIRKRK